MNYSLMNLLVLLPIHSNMLNHNFERNTFMQLFTIFILFSPPPFISFNFLRYVNKTLVYSFYILIIINLFVELSVVAL